jgi:hypothetical protein
MRVILADRSAPAGRSVAGRDPFFSPGRELFSDRLRERARRRAGDAVLVLSVRAESERSARGAARRTRVCIMSNLLFKLRFFDRRAARQEIRKSFRFDQAMTCPVT